MRKPLMAKNMSTPRMPCDDSFLSTPVVEEARLAVVQDDSNDSHRTPAIQSGDICLTTHWFALASRQQRLGNVRSGTVRRSGLGTPVWSPGGNDGIKHSKLAKEI